MKQKLLFRISKCVSGNMPAQWTGYILGMGKITVCSISKKNWKGGWPLL